MCNKDRHIIMLHILHIDKTLVFDSSGDVDVFSVNYVKCHHDNLFLCVQRIRLGMINVIYYYILTRN